MTKPKIVFLDTYYPPVIVEPTSTRTYEERLAELMSKCFGTSDFYSSFFNEEGWDAVDIVGNDTHGRDLWSKENGFHYNGVVNSVVDQLIKEDPDIVYCQDLNFLPVAVIKGMQRQFGFRFVAQHSCPWAGDHVVGAYDKVFTSFPHYIKRIKKTGADSEFLPIAFGGQNVFHRLDRTLYDRDLDITFVGGVNGGGGHWNAGTEFLDWIAQSFPENFKWWGYVIGNLPEGSALAKTYQGPAWGRDMYKIYLRSKIVVNRHGEVAEGYANNMRMFEATGCGAVLVTEDAPNMDQYFNPRTEIRTYKNTGDAVRICRELLEFPDWRRMTGALGFERTWKTNLYEQRLVPVEKILREMARR